MAIAKIPLRIVFYYAEDCWFARCLEFDLIGSGESKEEALRMLGEAIELQAHASLEANNPENLFSPAEGRYWRMWAQGRHVVMGELHLQVDQLTIEGIETREFSDGGLSMA